MLKAQGISDLTNRKTGCGKLFFGPFDQFFMNMLLCILPGVHPKQVTQVVGRQIHLRGDMLDGKQTGRITAKSMRHTTAFRTESVQGCIVFQEISAGGTYYHKKDLLCFTTGQKIRPNVVFFYSPFLASSIIADSSSTAASSPS